MIQKQFDLPEIGKVTIVKKRNNRNTRISFTSSGDIRISLPVYAPYQAGLSFARQKKQWIIKNQPPRPALIQDGQIVANTYRVTFTPRLETTKIICRIRGDIINVSLPASIQITDENVQAAAKRGINRAIKLKAEKELPIRLSELAERHRYKYRSIKIKPLQRRWGSCDSRGNITLNQYLVDLEPKLIDYVLLHELVHTVHPHHQASFWQTMKELVPALEILRKQARTQKPNIY